MKIVLVQSDEIREADFIKDVLDQLKEGRRKYGQQSALDMVVVHGGAMGRFIYERQMGHQIQATEQAVDLVVMTMRLLFDVEYETASMKDFFDEQFPDVQMTAEEKAELVELAEQESKDYRRCITGIVASNGDCLICHAAQGQSCRRGLDAHGQFLKHEKGIS